MGGKTLQATPLFSNYPTTSVPSVWEERGGVTMVSLISPQNPCGQNRLGCSRVDFGVVIFNGFPAQKRRKRKEEEKRGRKKAV